MSGFRLEFAKETPQTLSFHCTHKTPSAGEGGSRVLCEKAVDFSTKASVSL